MGRGAEPKVTRATDEGAAFDAIRRAAIPRTPTSATVRIVVLSALLLLALYTIFGIVRLEQGLKGQAHGLDPADGVREPHRRQPGAGGRRPAGGGLRRGAVSVQSN